MTRWMRNGIRAARRVVVAVMGGTVVAIGIALLVLPGPAFVVIPAGLAILSLEFAWARHWLRGLREAAQDAVGVSAPGSGAETEGGAGEAGEGTRPR